MKTLAELTAEEIDAMSTKELRELISASPEPGEEPESLEPLDELDVEPKEKPLEPVRDEDASDSADSYATSTPPIVFNASRCSHIVRAGRQCHMPLNPYSGATKLCGIHWHKHYRRARGRRVGGADRYGPDSQKQPIR